MNNSSAIKFIDLQQGTQEWLDFRKGKIGSSMAASIVGLGFRTPLELFEDIIEDRSTEVNEAMKRGNRLEPEARAYLNHKYTLKLEPVVIQHPDPKFDWHISSLDGITQMHSGTWFVTEIKCPGKEDHDLALQGIIPNKYMPQLLHIFEDIPSLESILYCSYHPNNPVEIIVLRNQKGISEQFKAEQEFYQRIINMNPPEPCEKDWVENNDKWIVFVAESYKQIKEEITRLERMAEEYKQSLLDIGVNHPRTKIGCIKMQKVIRQGNIDYSQIEALKGIDLEPYRKEPIVSWRITS